MSTIKAVAAIVVLTLLAGCKDVQTCNDSKAKKTVLQIISENSLPHTSKLSQKELQLITADAGLTDIKTTDGNDALGVYECAATYSVKYHDATSTVPVAYKLSHLEDKNDTDVRVQLGQAPLLIFNLSVAILKGKAEEFNKSLGEYVKKRGSDFAFAMAPCLTAKMGTYEQDHADKPFTIDSMAELEKTCTAEAGEYHKLVSDYVTKSGGVLQAERTSCIIWSAENKHVLPKQEMARDNFLADLDSECTAHSIPKGDYGYLYTTTISANVASDGGFYYEYSVPQPTSQKAAPLTSSPTSESNLPKLSAAAEKAITEGFVEIKNPNVKACTDAKIAAIKKQVGADSSIGFETYNEAAVACGFNL
jgi:hypothetical protein